MVLYKEELRLDENYDLELNVFSGGEVFRGDLSLGTKKIILKVRGEQYDSRIK